MFSKKDSKEKLKAKEDIKTEKVEKAEEVQLEIKEEKISQEQKNLDGWKRCQADFENYKKRQETLQWELAKYSGLNLILQILPVLDNFHAATDHIPADQKDDQWVVGIMYIQKQLEKILEDNGVKEIAAKAGDDFDPKIHEAISDSNLPKKEHSNDSNVLKIKKVTMKGYQMEEKVVRAARVIVE